MSKTTLHRKAPRRTLAIATVLTLAASLIALGASPAAAAGVGAGRVGGFFVYGYPGPLDAPSPVNWTADSVNFISPVVFTVGGRPWVGDGGGPVPVLVSYPTAISGVSTGTETYLDGHGSVGSFSVNGTNVLGESFSASLSGGYQRSGEQMTISLTGNATISDGGSVTSGPISVTITIAVSVLLDTDWIFNGNCADGCIWTGAYTQTDDSGGGDGLLPDLGWVPIPDDLEVIREVPNPIGTPSNDCDTFYGGQQISDNTTQGVHSKLYVREDAPDQVDVCVRVELVPSGEGYGGKLSITPTGLPDPGVGDPQIPDDDTNSGACTSTTPNQVPGSHPITSGGLGGTPYMIDAYKSDSVVWLCLEAGADHRRVIVPLPGAPNPSYDYVVTWYPDPGTP